MRICAIGDIHGKIDYIKSINLEGINLVLLVGDLGKANKLREITFKKNKGIKIDSIKEAKKEAFYESYNSIKDLIKEISNKAKKYKVKKVLIVYGNVEYKLEEIKRELREYKLPSLKDLFKKFRNVKLLNNKMIRINNIRIGGLKYFYDNDWVETFKPADYEKIKTKAEKETPKAKKVLKKFDNKIDILLAHQPPKGILDLVTNENAPKGWQNKNAGSKVIRDYLSNNSSLKYVFCGHIHESEGEEEYNNIKIYNLGFNKCRIINYNE